MTIKRIPVSQLQLGMYVEEIRGSSALNDLLWAKNFLVNDLRMLERIRSMDAREAWVDISKSENVPPELLVEDEPAEPRSSAKAEAYADIKPVTLAEEMRQAGRIFSESKTIVNSMFESASLGRSIDMAVLEKLVDDLSYSVARNPHAIISLSRLRRVSEYTGMNAVAVSAMMMALARQLNLDYDQVHSAGLAGLLHDLGKAAMPANLLNKTGKLLPKELAVIQSHASEGIRMLERIGVKDPIVLDVCLHHHEKIDGSGYPERLSGDQISLFAKMCAICDVYDAITSNRPYKAGWSPAETLRRMAGEMKGHFDPRIFQAFVKTIGAYPIGSLVRLESGRLAVVVEQTASLAVPKVKVFYHHQKGQIPVQEIDLTAPDAGDKIEKFEDPANWRFTDLNRYWVGDQLALLTED